MSARVTRKPDPDSDSDFNGEADRYGDRDCYIKSYGYGHRHSNLNPDCSALCP